MFTNDTNTKPFGSFWNITNSSIVLGDTSEMKVNPDYIEVANDYLYNVVSNSIVNIDLEKCTPKYINIICNEIARNCNDEEEFFTHIAELVVCIKINKYKVANSTLHSSIRDAKIKVTNVKTLIKSREKKLPILVDKVNCTPVMREKINKIIDFEAENVKQKLYAKIKEYRSAPSSHSFIESPSDENDKAFSDVSSNSIRDISVEGKSLMVEDDDDAGSGAVDDEDQSVRNTSNIFSALSENKPPPPAFPSSLIAASPPPMPASPVGPPPPSIFDAPKEEVEEKPPAPPPAPEPDDAVSTHTDDHDKDDEKILDIKDLDDEDEEDKKSVESDDDDDDDDDDATTVAADDDDDATTEADDEVVADEDHHNHKEPPPVEIPEPLAKIDDPPPEVRKDIEKKIKETIKKDEPAGPHFKYIETFDPNCGRAACRKLVHPNSTPHIRTLKMIKPKDKDDPYILKKINFCSFDCFEKDKMWYKVPTMIAKSIPTYLAPPAESSRSRNGSRGQPSRRPGKKKQGGG